MLYDLFTNNLTSMLRFYIISHHFMKLNKFFKRYIIINVDFRNIKTIELSIEKYSKISVYMIQNSIIYQEQQLSLLWGNIPPTIVGAQLVDKNCAYGILLKYKNHISRINLGYEIKVKNHCLFENAANEIHINE